MDKIHYVLTYTNSNSNSAFIKIHRNGVLYSANNSYENLEVGLFICDCDCKFIMQEMNKVLQTKSVTIFFVSLKIYCNIDKIIFN